MHSIGANVSVMVYKVVNPPPRKADYLSLTTGDMMFVVDNYIRSYARINMNLNFCANMAGFCRDSHIYVTH